MEVAGRAAPLAKTSAPAPLVQGTKQARESAILAATAGLDKKAVDIEIIDVAGKVDYADYLVLMTGTSDRHVASLVQGVEDEFHKRKLTILSVEGMPTAYWVLVDLGDVVVHVFQADARGLYDIEGLWMDANRIPLPERAARGSSPP
jgi:ribosome-associated protein